MHIGPGFRVCPMILGLILGLPLININIIIIMQCMRASEGMCLERVLSTFHRPLPETLEDKSKILAT